VTGNEINSHSSWDCYILLTSNSIDHGSTSQLSTHNYFHRDRGQDYMTLLKIVSLPSYLCKGEARPFSIHYLPMF